MNLGILDLKNPCHFPSQAVSSHRVPTSLSPLISSFSLCYPTAPKFSSFSPPSIRLSPLLPWLLPTHTVKASALSKSFPKNSLSSLLKRDSGASWWDDWNFTPDPCDFDKDPGWPHCYISAGSENHHSAHSAISIQKSRTHILQRRPKVGKAFGECLSVYPLEESLCTCGCLPLWLIFEFGPFADW